MRRMSDFDIIHMNGFVIFFVIFFLLLGLFLPLLPVILPASEYGDLQQTQITVESVEHIHQYKGASFYRITATDGRQFNISGRIKDTDRDIKEILSTGKEAAIRYYEHQFLFQGRKYAEEITVDGMCVAEYDNDEDRGLWMLYVLSGCCILLAVGGVIFLVWQVRNNRRKQRKRSEKLRRKYGSNKKKKGKK